VVCAVTLQPFKYDPNERYRHKFMIQSIIIPPAATEQDIDSLVMRQFSDVFMWVVSIAISV